MIELKRENTCNNSNEEKIQHGENEQNRDLERLFLRLSH